VNRGELYRVRRPGEDAKRARVFVVVSRPALIASRFSSVICAPIYSKRQGIATEVAVGIDEGLKHDSAILCDALVSMPKTMLTDFVGALSATRLADLATALRIALHVE
jgi:mRNA interferase MazF